MLMQAFVFLFSAEGAVLERNGSLKLNYSHLFDYHPENHNTKPGRTSSHWTQEEKRSPLLLLEYTTSIPKSIFRCLGQASSCFHQASEWALKKVWGCLAGEEQGARLQEDSPDLVCRLEPASPTPSSGTLSAGAPGWHSARTRSGLRLARDHRVPGDAPRAPWLQITGAALGRPAREPACSLARDHRPWLRTLKAGRRQGPSPGGEQWLAGSHGEAQHQARTSTSPEKCLPQVTRWLQQGRQVDVLSLKLCRHTRFWLRGCYLSMNVCSGPNVAFSRTMFCIS